MQNTALILGPSGRFGRHMAAAFRAAGWHLRLFDRARDDLDQAAQGVDIIVNGWNPSYPHWRAQVPGQTAQIIAAARTSGATVILPGNVYVFGPEMPATLRADTPQRAENPLGLVRREMEAAYRTSGVPVILLRAGDFIDTMASGNWFDRVLTAQLAKGVFRYMGPWDMPHAWAFLPDLTRAAVALAQQRDRLDRFEEVPFPGYTLTGEELAAALEQATGQSLRRKSFNWTLFRALGPVWPLMRHVLEMRYLWNAPHGLDGTRLQELLPDFTPTPVVRALGQTRLKPGETGVPAG